MGLSEQRLQHVDYFRQFITLIAVVHKVFSSNGKELYLGNIPQSIPLAELPCPDYTRGTNKVIRETMIMLHYYS
jgi:hypothetical protein